MKKTIVSSYKYFDSPFFFSLSLSAILYKENLPESVLPWLV